MPRAWRLGHKNNLVAMSNLVGELRLISMTISRFEASCCAQPKLVRVCLTVVMLRLATLARQGNYEIHFGNPLDSKKRARALESKPVSRRVMSARTCAFCPKVLAFWPTKISDTTICFVSHSTVWHPVMHTLLLAKRAASHFEYYDTDNLMIVHTILKLLRIWKLMLCKSLPKKRLYLGVHCHFEWDIL